jgi:hypothetical protein
MDIPSNSTLWKKLALALQSNNQEIWSTLWKSGVDVAFNTGQKAAIGEAIQAGLDKTKVVKRLTQTELRDKYFQDRGLEFVTSLSATDIDRLKPILADNLNMGEAEFARKYADSVSSPDRLEVIKRTESHRASMWSQNEHQKSIGARWKRRLTAGDGRVSEGGRVRDEHQDDADEGWISFSDPYPYTGEDYPGSDSVNCRCTQLVKFSEEQPTD